MPPYSINKTYTYITLQSTSPWLLTHYVEEAHAGPDGDGVDLAPVASSVPHGDVGDGEDPGGPLLPLDADVPVVGDDRRVHRQYRPRPLEPPRHLCQYGRRYTEMDIETKYRKRDRDSKMA